MSAPNETPITAIGHRMADAMQRVWAYDIGGEGGSVSDASKRTGWWPRPPSSGSP